MIRDLRGAGAQTAGGDVLVIGAGTIGLIVATELAEKGLRVICLESGDRDQAEETHPLNTVEQAGSPYAGAEHGRFRCLGGSSTRWGGALIPFQSADLSRADWPVQWQELAPYVTRVESLFGLPTGSYDEPSILGHSNHLGRLAKWPSFGKRNIYSLLRGKLDTQSGIDVWINATATEFTVRDSQLTEVRAHCDDGSQITVSAPRVVIACGAIESTRLLLLIDRQAGGVISEQCPTLGQGFHDHLSAIVAEVEPINRGALNRLVGFRFCPGGSMRNLRFELAPESPLRQQMSPCFAHIGFSATAGGFAALRDVFRALQCRRLPPKSVLFRLIANTPWLLKAIWWRFVHRRLLYPSDAKLELHMVIEQAPVPANRINLSQSQTDRWNQPLARIDWTVSDDDIATMERATTAFEQSWNAGPLAKLGRLVRRPIADVGKDMVSGGGIYHPGGSTRMARASKDGPVDHNLQVHGLRNLSVCATSVLPTGGGANPTLMAILLALRWVDQESASK